MSSRSRQFQSGHESTPESTSSNAPRSPRTVAETSEDPDPAVTCTIRCTPYLFAIIIVQVVATLVLGLEGYAFQEDRKWNKIVKGKRSWPLTTLHHHQYFEGKTLNLLPGRDDTLKELLFRKSSLDKVFMTLMILLLLISITHLVLMSLNYVQSTSIITTVLYGLMGLMSLSGASMIVHMVTVVYEKNYQKAADILRNNNITDLIEGGDAAKIIQLRMEELTLANIFSLCAHVSKPRTEPLSIKILNPCSEAEIKRGGQPLTLYLCNVNRITKTNSTEAYTVDNLDSFGFCNNSDIRIGVYCLSYVLVGLCWLVPVLIAFKSHFNQCIPKARPHE